MQTKNSTLGFGFIDVFLYQRRVESLIVRTLIMVCRIIDSEVFLVWDGGEKTKSQKDMAKGSKLGIKDDVTMLDYYRYRNTFDFI